MHIPNPWTNRHIREEEVDNVSYDLLPITDPDALKILQKYYPQGFSTNTAIRTPSTTVQRAKQLSVYLHSKTELTTFAQEHPGVVTRIQTWVKEHTTPKNLPTDARIVDVDEVLWFYFAAANLGKEVSDESKIGAQLRTILYSAWAEWRTMRQLPHHPLF